MRRMAEADVGGGPAKMHGTTATFATAAAMSSSSSTRWGSRHLPVLQTAPLVATAITHAHKVTEGNFRPVGGGGV